MQTVEGQAIESAAEGQELQQAVVTEAPAEEVMPAETAETEAKQAAEAVEQPVEELAEVTRDASVVEVEIPIVRQSRFVCVLVVTLRR